MPNRIRCSAHFVGGSGLAVGLPSLFSIWMLLIAPSMPGRIPPDKNPMFSPASCPPKSDSYRPISCIILYIRYHRGVCFEPVFTHNPQADPYPDHNGLVQLGLMWRLSEPVSGLSPFPPCQSITR